MSINKKMVLIAGESATGKSLSLRNLRNPERVLYLNCEAGKELPFRNNFDAKVISDPYQVFEAFDMTMVGAPLHGAYDTIVIDTLTFLMDMFETQYVLRATNKMEGWSNYGQYLKELMQEKVSVSDKNVLILAHTKDEYDKDDMEYKTSVPIKGSLKGNGVEAFFSTVVATKKVSIKDLEGQDPALVVPTEEDVEMGYKYVYQTRLTAKTKGERIRSPFQMFGRNQVYMDNDAQMLLDYLNNFYNGKAPV